MIIQFNKCWNLLSRIVSAYCLTLMITFNRTVQIVDVRSFLELFKTDAIISTVIFLLSIYFFSNLNLPLLKVREHIVVTVFSLFFAIFHVIGSDVTYTHSTLRGTVNKFSILAFLLLVLISYFPINTLLRLLLNWFKHQTLYSINTEKRYFRKKLYLLMLLPFVSVRVFMFFIFFPGSTTWDSMYTIQEGLGYWPLTNSHPYIYTWIVSLFSKLGIKYFGSLGIGVSIFNFLTLIITSVVVVFVLYKFFETFHTNIYLKIGLFLFYAFFSDFIIMSFALYKDVYLVNFLLLFFLSMIFMIYLPNRFFSNVYSLPLFILSFLGVYMLHRKAVIYVVVAVVLLFLYSKMYKKQIVKYVIISVVITLVFNTLGNIILKPEESQKKYDYLSSRFQQLAAAVYYHPESFTKSELEFYDSTLGLDNNKNFLYSVADPIKNVMNNEQFKGKEREFFKVWWKGYRNHPKTYIDAILNLSVSYWYIYNLPDMAYVSSYYVAMYSRENNWFGNQKIYDKGMTFSQGDNVHGKLYKHVDEIHWALGDLSTVGLFYRPGLYTICLLLILMLTILKRDRRLFPIVFFVVSIILTCIYSPIVNYFRYSYAYMMIIPLLLPLLFLKNSE
ncbi:DUF6020 family protein [Streptococcus sp.]